MTEAPSSAPISVAPAAPTHLVRRLVRNTSAITAISVLALIVLSAILAPVLSPFDPNRAEIQELLQPPSATHPLGTDGAGRDVLARLLFATRYSLAGALLGTAVAALIGITSGLLAGYYRKWFESAASATTSLVMALPGIVVLLAARSVVGPSLWMTMVVFGVLLAPAFYRLVYSAVVGVRNNLYIDAARVSGVNDASIIGRHILAVVRAPIVIQVAFVMGIAIAIQAGLDFLGLGDQTLPTWGNMLSDAFAKMYQNPILLVWPSVAIAVTSIALALFANALRDELDRTAPRRRRARAITGVDAAASLATSAPVSHADRTSDDVLLMVSDLRVGYDLPDGGTKQVVNGVSLTVRRGEVHGLIGESGSGKTQTAWSVLRLLPEGGRIIGGSVALDGTDLAGVDDSQMRHILGRRIGYIPQEPMSNLDPSFTVGSQLVEPMRIALGLSRSEARVRALELLRRVGIVDPQRAFDAYPHEISGGMAQRVLIAGAVSSEPEIIIADEPTTALDVTVQAEILDLLRELKDELNVGVLLVTHNIGVVADLCDRVSVMREGVIVETGPSEALFAAPQHPYTRSLFAAVLEDGAARGALVHSSDRHIPASGDPS